MGLWAKIFKGGSKVAKVTKGAKATVKTVKLSNVGIKTAGALAGLSTFFGLEWLVNGGLTRSTADALGIPDWLSSVLWMGILVAVLIMVLWFVARKLGLNKKRRR